MPLHSLDRVERDEPRRDGDQSGDDVNREQSHGDRLTTVAGTPLIRSHGPRISSNAAIGSQTSWLTWRSPARSSGSATKSRADENTPSQARGRGIMRPR